MKKAILAALLAFASLAAIVGCGGSDPAGGGTTSARQRIVNMVLTGSMARGNGAEMANLGGGPLARAARDPYYSDWLELWVVDSATETSYESLYFVDEALTQEAGHSRYLWTQAESGAFSQTFDEKITAGPMSGTENMGLYQMTADGTVTCVFSGRSPQFGSYEGEGVWSPSGFGSYRSRYTDTNGVWTEYQCAYGVDGASTVQMSNSEGFGFVMNFAPDMSGNGQITGNADGLPATMVWDTNGQGTITWADGTTSPFELWGSVSSGGGSSGGTGGSDGSDGQGG